MQTVVLTTRFEIRGNFQGGGADGFGRLKPC
jgi:hypothetical protein